MGERGLGGWGAVLDLSRLAMTLKGLIVIHDLNRCCIIVWVLLWVTCLRFIHCESHRWASISGHAHAGPGSKDYCASSPRGSLHKDHGESAVRC